MVLGSRKVMVNSARHKIIGFTLLELLITLAVISVLAAISITSYSQYTIRANRTDAKIALTRLAQQEERYFTTHRNYLYGQDALDKLGVVDGKSEDKLYKLAVEKLGSKGYLLKATAIEGESQFVRDESCREFSLDHTGKESAKDSSGKSDVGVIAECWGH